MQALVDQGEPKRLIQATEAAFAVWKALLWIAPPGGTSWHVSAVSA